MAHLRARRSALFGAVVTGMVLCLASVAFACSSSWTGELIVRGPGGSATAIGSAVDPNMSYCAGWPRGTMKLYTASRNTFTAIMESASDGCTGANNVPAPVRAQINIVPSVAAFSTDNLTVNGTSRVWGALTAGNFPGDCHNIGPNVVGNIAGLQTASTPNRAATWTVTWGSGSAVANAAHQASGLCVEYPTESFNGMEVPIVFV
ncbi:MAG: hypothetical protein M3083_10360 [Actinomycetota bacterium]|nr:hypothetical protein [Actinomycetota bacterium]